MRRVALDGICLPCRVDLHEECSVGLAGDLAEDATCCCGGLYDRFAHLGEVRKAEIAAGAADLDEEAGSDSPKVAVEQKRGDSGYIHPDAWPSESDIGTLTDVSSTGRKRAARMYPISPGQQCEWAKLKHAGGGPFPIIGCMGNPATDIHHGVDKNTLNNEKQSRGVGTRENVHLICSDCHNAWHAANDEHYPEYDRQAQQEQPWIPNYLGDWGPQFSDEQASFEELVEVARVREKRRSKRGKQRSGRNGQSRGGTHLGIADDGEDGRGTADAAGEGRGEDPAEEK